MSTKLQAITFDFWDTIVQDNSDEPKRAAKGLASKADTRQSLFVEEVSKHHPELSKEAIQTAYESANNWFLTEWKEHHRTPTVSARLGHALDQLSLPKTPGFAQVVEAFETMEIETPPAFAPGIQDTLRTLSKTYKLGIISDTIVTPGRGLQQILQNAGLLDSFCAFVFSDEIGAAKPNPIMFQEASKQFGVPLEAMAHIGDRESNDVVGPQDAGAKGIYYTGVVNRGPATRTPDLTYDDHSQLAALLSQMGQ